MPDSYKKFVVLLLEPTIMNFKVNILVWIVFGLIAGVTANLLDPSPAKGGILGAILLGIAGSLLGGFLGNILFGVTVTGFNLQSFFIAIAGSLILLFMGRVLNRA